MTARENISIMTPKNIKRNLENNDSKNNINASLFNYSSPKNHKNSQSIDTFIFPHQISKHTQEIKKEIFLTTQENENSTQVDAVIDIFFKVNSCLKKLSNSFNSLNYAFIQLDTINDYNSFVLSNLNKRLNEIEEKQRKTQKLFSNNNFYND